jgi:hypothetical protein
MSSRGIRAAVRAAFLVSACLCGATGRASAQLVARTFDDLPLRVAVGDVVTVTDASAQETRGRVSALSSASISILVHGEPRTFATPEVRLIQRRRVDSLLNGALIGAAAAGVPMTVLAAGVCEDEIGECMPYVAGYALVGAAIGLVVDAFVMGRETVYLPDVQAVARVSVSPMLGPRVAGARVTVSLP